jgi:hypothetical protein
MATAVGLMLFLPAVSPGCGSGAPEVDKAVQYTPESLARELAFRYRTLTPEAKQAPTRVRKRSKSGKTIAQLESAEKLQKKGKDAPTVKQARAGKLDDLLDDIDRKLELIKDVSRPDACRQMGESIAKDDSLDEKAKKLLAEKLKELGDPSS